MEHASLHGCGLLWDLKISHDRHKHVLVYVVIPEREAGCVIVFFVLRYFVMFEQEKFPIEWCAVRSMATLSLSLSLF